MSTPPSLPLSSSLGRPSSAKLQLHSTLLRDASISSMREGFTAKLGDHDFQSCCVLVSPPAYMACSVVVGQNQKALAVAENFAQNTSQPASQRIALPVNHCNSSETVIGAHPTETYNFQEGSRAAPPRTRVKRKEV